MTGSALLLSWLLAALTAGPASAGMGCHAGIERDAEETTVVLTANCMNPLVARVPVGATVTFRNGDKQTHAITGAANTWGTYDELAGGTSVAYRFTATGVFPYFCYIHPGMIGAVVVGDGGPGGGGATVERVAANVPARASASSVAAATKAPSATQTASSAAAAAAPVAPVAPTSATPGEPGPAVAPLTIGLLVVLAALVAAYVLGLLPGVTRPRTRSR
jgi:plastocyanin